MNVAILACLVPVGSADELHDGTAHLLEHVIHGDPKGLGALRAVSGVSVHAVTTPGWTAYTATMPPAVLTHVSGIFRRIVDPAVFDRDTVERQRAVISQEIHELRSPNLRQDRINVFERELFAGTLLAQHPLGERNALRRLTMEDLNSLHELYLSRPPVVIAAGPQIPSAGGLALRADWGKVLTVAWSSPTSVTMKSAARTDRELTSLRLEQEIVLASSGRRRTHLYRLAATPDLPPQRRAAAGDWLTLAMSLAMEGSLQWALEQPFLQSSDFSLRLDWTGGDQVLFVGQGSLAGHTEAATVEHAVQSWLETLASGRLRPELIAAADHALRTRLARSLDLETVFCLAQQLLNWGEAVTPPLLDLTRCAKDAQQLATKLLVAARQGRLTLLPGDTS